MSQGAPLNGLRLLVVTSLFPPATGGASEDFRLLAAAWQECSAINHIVILTERRKGSPRREDRGKILIRRVLPSRDTNLRLNAALRMIRSAFTYPLLTLAIVWHMHRESTRAVLVHGRYGRKSFLRILKLCGAKVAVFLSDHYTSPRNLSHCDAIICIAENVHDRATRDLGPTSKIHYVPLPFIQPSSAPSSMSNLPRPYFLFIGTACAQKGVDVLLEAFAVFRREKPGFRLLLAGPIREYSLTRIAGSGTTFLGEVDRSRVLTLIQQAEAVVLPSRSEALPRVCLEAIALGTTAICPPGVPELERACPEWVLPSITPQNVLEKLRQAVNSSFQVSFRFEKHDSRLVAHRIAEVCSAMLEDADDSKRLRAPGLPF